VNGKSFAQLKKEKPSGNSVRRSKHSHFMSGGIGVVVATTRAMDDSISIISSEYVFDTYNDQRLQKYVDQVLKNSSC